MGGGHMAPPRKLCFREKNWCGPKARLLYYFKFCSIRHILAKKLGRVVQRFKFYDAFVGGGQAIYVISEEGNFLKLGQKLT